MSMDPGVQLRLGNICARFEDFFADVVADACTRRVLRILRAEWRLTWICFERIGLHYKCLEEWDYVLRLWDQITDSSCLESGITDNKGPFDRLLMELKRHNAALEKASYACEENLVLTREQALALR